MQSNEINFNHSRKKKRSSRKFDKNLPKPIRKQASLVETNRRKPLFRNLRQEKSHLKVSPSLLYADRFWATEKPDSRRRNLKRRCRAETETTPAAGAKTPPET